MNEEPVWWKIVCDNIPKGWVAEIWDDGKGWSWWLPSAMTCCAHPRTDIVPMRDAAALVRRLANQDARARGYHEPFPPMKTGEGEAKPPSTEQDLPACAGCGNAMRDKDIVGWSGGVAHEGEYPLCAECFTDRDKKRDDGGNEIGLPKTPAKFEPPSDEPEIFSCSDCGRPLEEKHVAAWKGEEGSNALCKTCFDTAFEPEGEQSLDLFMVDQEMRQRRADAEIEIGDVVRIAVEARVIGVDSRGTIDAMTAQKWTCCVPSSYATVIKKREDL